MGLLFADGKPLCLVQLQFFGPKLSTTRVLIIVTVYFGVAFENAKSAFGFGAKLTLCVTLVAIALLSRGPVPNSLTDEGWTPVAESPGETLQVFYKIEYKSSIKTRVRGIILIGDIRSLDSSI